MCYGEKAITVATDGITLAMKQLGTDTHSATLVAWGWNTMLKHSLLKAGIAPQQVPSDSAIDEIRGLQHRTTALTLQPESHAVRTVDEVQRLLTTTPSMVLKAPWSGSGRGLRWVRTMLSEHDKAWLKRVVREQDCVIAEPRRNVVADFALEYTIDTNKINFEGYSLFETMNGVYRHNLLWHDTHIESHIATLGEGLTAMRLMVEQWLMAHVVGHYKGPLGVDLYVDDHRSIYVSEINYRHTMGLMATRYLKSHPDAEGKQLGIAYHPTAITPYKTFIR